MLKKLLLSVSRHKITAIAAIIILAGGGYYGYQYFFTTAGAVRYVTAAAGKGTLIVSVSGSGQVSASNQVDIKSKVSGDAVFVGVKNGDTVKTGTLLAQLDARDAQKSVRDAEANLQSAKLSLEKLKQPADALSIIQAENALAQAKEAKQNAESDLQKSHESGFNSIADAFLDTPSIMAGIDDMFFDNTLDKGQSNIDWYANRALEDARVFVYRDDFLNSYQTARKKYDKNLDNYKLVSRSSDVAVTESLVYETYETVKVIADAVKSAHDYVGFVSDYSAQYDIPIPSTVSTHISTLNSYTGTINNHVTGILSDKQAIEDSKKAIISAGRSIVEKTESLANLKAGPDALDIQSSELSVKQRENTLLDAKEKLADYFIRAPFDGVAAEINIKTGDSVSSSAVIATLITSSRIAEVSLNEVDVAKVKTGQKATLTFDAVPDLSIAGQVAGIAAIGSVTQGVVTYNVKISFDAQDERVKPGMSVSVAIITDVKQDVVMVPNSAVKTSGNPRTEGAEQSSYDGNARYVEILVGGAPEQRAVEIGLSNDTSTEITSGLKEGEPVVTQTIDAAVAQTSSSQSSGLRIPGLNTGGGTLRR